jgi:NAD(P)-dependent dehydrogenase (short-subunit alcohol dehydrogenase family)
MLLKDKVAIVTGGAGALGDASCLIFSREGAKVVVADINPEGARTTEKRITAAGGEATSFALDVTDHAKVDQLVHFTLDKFGRIDVLFNCVGYNLFKPLEDISPEFWNQLMNVNLNGVWYCCQAVAEEMKRNRSGRIINVGSGAGIMGIPKSPYYVAAKHGIVGLTKALAIDLGPYNINVNCICPGTFVSPLLERAVSKMWMEDMFKRTPLGRFAKPEEIANAALFLASDLSSYVTGAALSVDGGITCLLAGYYY